MALIPPPLGAAARFVPPRARLARLALGLMLASMLLPVAGTTIQFPAAKLSLEVGQRSELATARIHEVHAAEKARALADLKAGGIDGAEYSRRLGRSAEKRDAMIDGNDVATARRMRPAIAGQSIAAFLRRGPFLAAVLVAGCGLALRLRAEGLCRLLAARGHEWATVSDAMWLLLVLRCRAGQLPSANEIAILPGIPANIDGLIAFDRMRRRHRRDSR